MSVPPLNLITAAEAVDKGLDDLMARRIDVDEWLRLREVYLAAIEADMAVRRASWAEDDARRHRQRWWRHPIRTFRELFSRGDA